MAVIYYPKNSVIFTRNAIGLPYEQLVLSSHPDTILYFGEGSELTAFSASTIYITSSYANTASYIDYAVASVATASYTVSSSYASSSSFAIIVTASYSKTASYIEFSSASVATASYTVSSSYSVSSSYQPQFDLKSIKTVSSFYQMNIEDYTVLCNVTASVVVTLPNSNISSGRIFNIKKIDNSGFSVTVTGSFPGQTIDGQKSKIISTQYANMAVQCSGSLWFIL